MTNQHTEVVVIGAGYAGLLATVRLAGQTRGLLCGQQAHRTGPDAG